MRLSMSCTNSSPDSRSPHPQNGLIYGRRAPKRYLHPWNGLFYGCSVPKRYPHPQNGLIYGRRASNELRQPAVLSKLRSSAQGLLRLLSATTAQSISKVKPPDKRGAHQYTTKRGPSYGKQIGFTYDDTQNIKDRRTEHNSEFWTTVKLKVTG